MTSLTQALPLQRGIYNRLQFLLIKYMTEVNVWTRQIFNAAQYSYRKDDLASKQRPSIFVYPGKARKDSFSYSYKGTITMEFHFSFTKQRTELADIVTQIMGDIELINLNCQFTEYLQQEMPGLLWFGKFAESDYTKIYDKECVAKIEFDFNVDLMRYQNSLQNIGCDITSPDEQIYDLAESLLEQIAILDNDLNPVFVYE
jgi:hypothetical protein